MTDKSSVLTKIREALNAGEREDAVAAVQKALDHGLGVAQIRCNGCRSGSYLP